MTIDAKRAEELVSQFAGKRVLVIGDVVLDRYVSGVVERINPEAPVPILHAKEDSFATGGAGNTAKNAAQLGAVATLISVVGDDASAQDVRRAAEQEGYAATLIADPSRPTIEKKRYLVGGQQMLRVDFEERHEITGQIEIGVIDAVREAAEKADIIIVSDYAKGVVTEAVSQAIMSTAKQNNLPVMADVKPARARHFKGATYMSPNRKEAHEYLGLSEHDNGGLDYQDIAKRVNEELETNAFLTLSEDGMYIYSEDTQQHVPQDHQIEIADTSGCGDTTATAICLAKLAGATDEEAAVMGNAAGAMNATKVGAQAVTPEELLQMLDEKS